MASQSPQFNRDDGIYESEAVVQESAGSKNREAQAAQKRVGREAGVIRTGPFSHLPALKSFYVPSTVWGILSGK